LSKIQISFCNFQNLFQKKTPELLVQGFNQISIR